MRYIRAFSLLPIFAACGGTDLPSSFGTIQERLALFDYSASATNSATDPNRSADSFVALNAGEAVMIATCVVNEATYVGDTFLRLYWSGTEVASNDDYCNGLGSRMAYTPSVSGSYMIRAGCWSTGSCSGTVALARRRGAPVAFTASNTNYAQLNTINRQYSFNGGDFVRVSTCAYNASGATATGDTYLRLYRNDGGVYTLVAQNEAAATGSCGTAAEITYSVPTAGYYQFRVGCTSNTACSGNVAVYVE